MPTQKPKPKRRPAAASAASSEIRFQWFGVKEEDTRRRGKQFYKLETLASATERLVRTKDRVITASARAAIGPSDLTSMTFELIGERPNAFVFRLHAGNAHRNRHTFNYLAAKSDGKHSEALAAEFERLRAFAQRAPKHFPKMFRSGSVFLPDRIRRRSQGREIAIYLTQAQGAMEVLDGNERGQFVLTGTEGRRALSLRDTEVLKASVMEALAATYDPDTREMMAPPDLAAAELLAHRSPKGTLRLRVCGCHALLQGLAPGRFLESLVLAYSRLGEGKFAFAPEEPTALCEAIASARGKDNARAWLSTYIDQVDHGRLKCHGEDYLEGLREYLG